MKTEQKLRRQIRVLKLEKEVLKLQKEISELTNKPYWPVYPTYPIYPTYPTYIPPIVTRTNDTVTYTNSQDIFLTFE
jgi:hypothetical protein